jgi:transposase
MRLYSNQHRYYCGIDLHAKTMYVCVLDQAGAVMVHRNLPTTREAFEKVIGPFREEVVVCVECMFSWYWIADLCSELGVAFVLGHALYMKAIHGGKSKNDKIDSQKIAALLRGGMLPMAHAYPQEHRSTRDLLRRRMYLMHQQSELLAHIQNTNTQYNLPGLEKRIGSPSNRISLAEHFEEPMVRMSIEADMEVLDRLHEVLLKIERTVLAQAREADPVDLQLLRTVPGIGKILALVILYEVEDVKRFVKVGNFISYARLVKCSRESAGKKSGARNSKIGNAHLKWAFSEAAVLFLRDHQAAKDWHEKLVGRYGKGKALSIMAQKLGRTVYFMLKRKEPFDSKRFFAQEV